MSDEQSAAELEPKSMPAPRGLASWRQTALAVAVLIIGMAIGASCVIVFGRGALLRGLAPPLGVIPDRVMDRLSRDLEMTPEQRDEVRAVVAKRMRRLREIQADARQETNGQLDSMRDEAARALDPRQAERWRKRFEEARRAGGPPPPGPWGPAPPPGPRPPGPGMPPGPMAPPPRPGAP